MDLMVEASPRRVFANAHTYHINSISVNSDNETYLSADDLRINLWHLEITDRSFSILKYMWAFLSVHLPNPRNSSEYEIIDYQTDQHQCPLFTRIEQFFLFMYSLTCFHHLR